jgi:hypothetical protein
MSVARDMALMVRHVQNSTNNNNWTLALVADSEPNTYLEQSNYSIGVLILFLTFEQAIIWLQRRWWSKDIAVEVALRGWFDFADAWFVVSKFCDLPVRLSLRVLFGTCSRRKVPLRDFLTPTMAKAAPKATIRPCYNGVNINITVWTLFYYHIW